MTAPASFFGGNSDGAMAMESWLWEMCRGCVHETRPEARAPSAEGLAGMDCTLPAGAYADPHNDIEEWSSDAAPAGPYGLRCMAHELRPTPEALASRPSGQIQGQQRLTVSA